MKLEAGNIWHWLGNYYDVISSIDVLETLFSGNHVLYSFNCLYFVDSYALVADLRLL